MQRTCDVAVAICQQAKRAKGSVVVTNILIKTDMIASMSSTDPVRTRTNPLPNELDFHKETEFSESEAQVTQFSENHRKNRKVTQPSKTREVV
jgi:hypothetical protein